MKALVLLGVGNELRGDDGCGIVAARRLRARLPELLVVEASGEGVGLMEAWQGAEAVLLIDAVRSGAAPGTIYRLDAHDQPLPASFFSYSTHAFSLAEAVELARALGQLPGRCIVFGIEGATFAPGAGLSPAVEAAVEAVVGRVMDEIAAWG